MLGCNTRSGTIIHVIPASPYWMLTIQGIAYFHMLMLVNSRAWLWDRVLDHCLGLAAGLILLTEIVMLLTQRLIQRLIFCPLAISAILVFLGRMILALAFAPEPISAGIFAVIYGSMGATQVVLLVFYPRIVHWRGWKETPSSDPKLSVIAEEK